MVSDDAELISEAAGHAGTRLLVAEATRTWLYDALTAGSGQEDYTSVLRHIIGAVPGP